MSNSQNTSEFQTFSQNSPINEEEEEEEEEEEKLEPRRAPISTESP